MHLVPVPLYIALQMIPFLVLIFALKALVFDPLLDYLEERHRRITGFSNDAKVMEAEAESRAKEIEVQLARARAEISELRSSVLKEAAAEETRIIASARAQAEEQATKFRAELSDVKRAASEALRAEVEKLSQDIASRVLGRTIV